MKKLSLHFGLNAVNPAAYGGWTGNLNACEYDALDMSKEAERRGFTFDVRLTKDATSQAFKSWCQNAANQAVSGDLVFITYSGHGGQVADQSSDEPDGFDETLCLWDGEVTDDWVKSQLTQFKKGVRIVTMFDSCHSETAARVLQNPLPRPKFAPQSVSDVATVISAAKTDNQITAHHLHFGACRDWQVAYDGVQNGMFTGAILRALEAHPVGHGYNSIHSFARAICLPLQHPTLKQLGRPLTGFHRQEFLK